MSQSFKFELDVEYDEGHSPYTCEMTRESDTTVIVSCQSNPEFEEWESGWAHYPSVNIPSQHIVDIAIPAKRSPGWDGIKNIFVSSPSEVELDSFEVDIDLSEEVSEYEEPITATTLHLYEEKVVEILTDFIDRPRDVLE
jgi:hypothetical protein